MRLPHLDTLCHLLALVPARAVERVLPAPASLPRAHGAVHGWGEGALATLNQPLALNQAKVATQLKAALAIRAVLRPIGQGHHDLPVVIGAVGAKKVNHGHALVGRVHPAGAEAGPTLVQVVLEAAKVLPGDQFAL